MHVDDGFRVRIDEIENVFIPMPDGCRIAARLWLPKDALAAPVPAILECIPYRKRDFMRSRDESLHRYVAARGYAVLRVDVRGSGDSEGVLSDEYTPAEQDDACALIAWLAAQPWCSGAVGMFGISWGGFGALQAAARRPPALKAIMTLCAADDRWADDAHYMGGCLLNENLQWGSVLMLDASLPPDPLIVGPRWRAMWQERIARLEPFPARWMAHPARDAYWRQGSVNEDYAAIACPVYAIGGWADAYSNAVPRLLAHLRAPCKGLVGPWPHAFPHDARPGPSIGFLQEALRWWDHWLKQRDTGLMDEPRYRVWMQEPLPPRPQPAQWPGRWVAEPSWPSAGVQATPWFLARGSLLPQASAAADVVSVRSPQTVGASGGEWCGFGAADDLPRDQRADDGGSLVFDGAPLAARMELLGAPVAELAVRVSESRACLCVRLADVAPDGSVARVSYALLDLAYRARRDVRTAVPTGTWFPVRVQLNDCAHAFPVGHRLRLAVSTAYWPIAWPAPRPVTLDVQTADCRVLLPVRTPRPDDAALRAFEPPEAAPSDAGAVATAPAPHRRLAFDLATDELTSTLRSGGTLAMPRLTHLPTIGLDLGQEFSRTFRIRADDPLSASASVEQCAVLRREGWDIRVTCTTRLTATAEHYHFTAALRAFENDELAGTRDWVLDIPRDPA